MAKRNKKPIKPHPCILGVSAGNGVSLYPFKEYLIGNVELRSDFYVKGQPKQWEINFSVPMWKTLPDLKVKPRIIIGNPKCGHSSMFALSRGKKTTSHVGEPSLDLFFRAIIQYTPDIFLMENLPKLLESYSVEDIKKMFPEYRILTWTGSVAHFGNSQKTRERLLILGTRNWKVTSFQTNRLIRVPKMPEILKPIEDLLRNLPKNGHITEPLDDIITLYAGFKISLSDLRDFWLENPDLKHYPVNNGRMNTAPGVYINREGNLPMTVRKTNRQFNSQGIQMSPRELARIQGIPDGFLLWDNGSKTAINKGRVTVANTPPYQLAEWFKGNLRKLGLL